LNRPVLTQNKKSLLLLLMQVKILLQEAGLSGKPLTWGTEADT
jgi:hypothetical protein